MHDKSTNSWIVIITRYGQNKYIEKVLNLFDKISLQNAIS